MAFGKSPRMDNRRSSSSNCSTTTFVVFVALCLVGVWMMTSSTIVPLEMPSSETKSEMKEQVLETGSKPFEDSSGDVPDDVKREDTTKNANTSPDESNSGTSPDQDSSENPTENPADKVQEEEPGKEDMKNESEDMSKSSTFSDTNGNTEGGETNKETGDASSEGVETNVGNQADGQDKGTQNDSRDTENNEQDKNTEQHPDETVNIEQDKKSEQNPNDSASDGQQQSDGEIKQEDKSDVVQDENGQGQIEKVETGNEKVTEQNSDENGTGSEAKDQGSSEVLPDVAQSELLNETNAQNGAWSTQSAESKNEKEVQASSSSKGETTSDAWKLCNVAAGADYIPCLDNEEAIKKLKTTKHYEHRERHCPEDPPTCLVPLPDGYRRSIQWPNSRDKIWYHNVPHTQLAVVKGHQNWVKVSGEYLTFPGGGTQFTHGALHYIDFIQEALPDIAWGKQSRVVLDVGCGVASFGGFLFDRDVLTMSLAPKDEHEAQVQFALERGIPAISAVMGTKRLPFPSRVFDVVHCARCRVPWHIEGGKLLLELNRLLRPGGYFVWSATPVYQQLEDDVEIWEAMSALTKSMCWKMVAKTKDGVNKVGLAIYRKPSNNECYEKRTKENPPLCQESDDPNAAWNVLLEACMHKLPVNPAIRGSKWPEQWPLRVEKTPYWLNSSQVGVYGKAAPEDFQADYALWKHIISKSYMNGMGINWSTVRNVMDMRSVYGGFAAALREMKIWVMNVVTIDSPDTLPIIYERGLFGIYHDWCESFSTYPRSYDLLHADHLFSKVKKRCKLASVVAEVDRVLRPEGKLIVRDNVETINEVESMARSLQWEIRLTYSKQREGLLCVQKSMWRPKAIEGST